MSAKQTLGETVTVAGGRLQGKRLTEVKALAWLGVPYALPPVGRLRWKAPREAEPWAGVLPVLDFRRGSVQVVQGVACGSEDCLYLNVWRPDHAESDLPVFVYLHGGGNIVGSGSDFHGAQLAVETDSVVVTVNYRLGAMGFFRHPSLLAGNPLDDSGNYGLLDILQALRWVNRNIRSFGGDPNNVTLAGQSAGARNALAAYLSPLSHGLFHKLYAMSGGFTTATIEEGEAKANDMVIALLQQSEIVRTRQEANEWIATKSNDAISDFLRGQEAFRFAEAIGETGLRMAAFPHLFEDGTVLPHGGYARLNPGDQPSLPVVLGSTASEFSGFASADSRFSPLVQSGRWLEHTEHKTLYEAAVQYGSDLYAAFNVEEVADKMAALHPETPIYAYRFGWGLQEGVTDASVRFLLGAPHGADLPFYTGDFSAVQPAGIMTERNEPGRKALSSLMRGYLRRFLHTGDPNGEGWPAWERWSADPRSAEILFLDAKEEQAVVQRKQKLNRKEIKEKLDQDPRLSAEHRRWLKTQLFAGRFFWKE